MRKLLNTLYITNEQAYLKLDGNNIVCLVEDDEKFRIPFDNVESIVCFGYRGCSPALMGKCVENSVSLSFISPQGRFLANVCGSTKGSVYLRIAQIDLFRSGALELAQNSMAAKFGNCISLINRSRHDIQELRTDEDISRVITVLKGGIANAYKATSPEELLGIEGYCASEYFSIFGKLFTNSNVNFCYRTKRPPLDPVNATLSFLYTIYTNEYTAAIETVGLDHQIGFYHALRSGRSSLACDMVEEARCHVERITLTLFNLNMLQKDDFETQISGAVWLNDDGRRKVLTKWQEKKREDIKHPYLNQKIPFGLLPYVQANLLAKYVRGEIPEYPCYLNR